MTIQEIVARIYGCLSELRQKNIRPGWVVLHRDRYRELMAWHRWLGELPSGGDYISPDSLFDVPLALDNTVDAAVVDDHGQTRLRIDRETGSPRWGTEHGTDR